MVYISFNATIQLKNMREGIVGGERLFNLREYGIGVTAKRLLDLRANEAGREFSIVNGPSSSLRVSRAEMTTAFTANFLTTGARRSSHSILLAALSAYDLLNSSFF